MDPIPIFDFQPDADLNNWTVVNDGVMGGRSRSTLSLDQAGHGVFSGRVSLENNGGFASIRLQCGRIDLNSKAMVLRVKGDGKRYQFRIRARKNDYYSYIHYFETSGDWEDISLPLADFYPTFRGRKLDLPNFSGNVLEEIGILIGNKRPENFQLLIDSIGLKAN
ncbi:MAG: CIA30 family protein [Robiginitalea sp.]